MPTALFLSPHLDDAVFSAGGVAALLTDKGWHTVLATVFTRTVIPVSGFALACQVDKGLSPDVDYMAMRRAEDLAASALIGFRDNRWLDLPEAPHRGYESAPSLFGDLRETDGVNIALQAALLALKADIQPDIILVPQGLGNHVDHQHVTAAARSTFPSDQLAYWRDTPYAIRDGAASPLPNIPCATDVAVPIARVLARKVAAAQAYSTQIGFQFGGADALALSLTRFADGEGSGAPAERLCGDAAQRIAAAAYIP